MGKWLALAGECAASIEKGGLRIALDIHPANGWSSRKYKGRIFVYFTYPSMYSIHLHCYRLTLTRSLIGAAVPFENLCFPILRSQHHFLVTSQVAWREVNKGIIRNEWEDKTNSDTWYSSSFIHSFNLSPPQTNDSTTLRGGRKSRRLLIILSYDTTHNIISEMLITTAALSRLWTADEFWKWFGWRVLCYTGALLHKD